MGVGAGRGHVGDAPIGCGNGGSFASHDGEVGPVSVDEFEGRVLCTCGESRVKCELRGGEMVSPVVLSLIAEDAKILFDFLVHAFGLSIALRVVSRGKTRFNAEVLVQGSHETCCKLRAAIGVNLSRDAVESKTVFVVKIGGTFGCDRVVGEREVGLTSHVVDVGADRGVVPGDW